MKVLFLTDGIYPFQLGGMQKHSLVLSKLLTQRHIELCVYHCGGINYSSHEFYNQFLESEVKVEEKVIGFPKLDKFPGHYIRENKKYSALIYEDIKDRLTEFDLIYGQGFSAWYFIKMKKKKMFSLPIFVNFHGFEMFQTPPNTRAKFEFSLFKKAVKYNVLNADFVYSFGGQITDILKKIGVSSDKILLQSNGIQEDWIREVQSDLNINQPRTFTFIGRNERRKGIEELNQALNGIIKNKVINFRFNFVGPIPVSHQICDSRIEYHGEIRNSKKIKEILLKSDCLVCPSHSEGMPTVILEGMAIGLAIIATDVGAVSRQIEGNGFLLDNPNPKKLEKAILKIIDLSDDDLLSMKKRSLEIVKGRFLWSVIVAQKEQDFQRVLKENT